MKKLIFLFVLMWFSFNAAKGVDPSCLFNATANCNVEVAAMFSIRASSELETSTEIFIDTCGFRDINGKPFQPDSLNVGKNIYELNLKPEKRIYSKEVFMFEFPYFPFDTSNYNMDTVTFFTINDIKQELSEIKDSLLSIINITGEIKFYQTFSIWKKYSNITHNLKKFYLSFENLVNTYETEEIINNFNIAGFKCEFLSYFHYFASVYEGNENIKLYPNPASDAVFMYIKEHFNTLKITNANGDVVKEFTLEEIRNFNTNQKIAFKVSELNTGVYFIIIDNKYVEKLVIAR
ncbi:MAG TPA: T9SS type A sorting domain-containing protein [Candidatus Kapabacteria bacterium]|nr:T9SS type A sorting domain-containing protein [Candidatus Kapabacteria bacterium]HPO63257.1 T9SS type A sorting domain-containing protein [Candidatus Kapabacteria bacterium]